MYLFKKVSTLDDSQYRQVHQNIKTYSTGPALDCGVQAALNEFLAAVEFRKEMLSSQAELNQLNEVMSLVNQALRQQVSLDFLPVTLKQYGCIPARHHDYFACMLQYSKDIPFFFHLIMHISLLWNPNQEINHALAIFIETMNAHQKQVCDQGNGVVSYQNADGNQTAFYV